MSEGEPAAPGSREAFACPACRGRDYEPVTVSSEFDTLFETGVFRCTKCRFGFLNPQRYFKPSAG
jgi:hypothetical protein